MMINNKPTTVASFAVGDKDQVSVQLIGFGKVLIPAKFFTVKMPCKICGTKTNHEIEYMNKQEPGKNISYNARCLGSKHCNRIRTYSMPLNKWNEIVVSTFNLESRVANMHILDK
ncbi:hypothetical protein A3I25_01840 [Candidatus Nomurabacteria bacterium RIFCSPLOWO2_02_FULL_42_17]|uniref:Uncharacterized protein n=1 Tax=Candidatus Nomurabacteria bacterium RIFCSPLOWO2_02_FULL_42_17 TaxID=1801789 RepID=A0A1F6XQK1_9BACT|nr:MAG: hypothetical protein A3I25_01840 [Candidatus Nomurabacteria bacterium RIFCSPLOWO2_02_FULL_42_17]